MDETIRSITGGSRNHLGRFVPGVSGNPAGRPPDSFEKKIERKAVKQLVEEYKQGLAEALPVIRPILIRKASEGDVGAIREVHDRVMGKAHQTTDITSGGEKITPENQAAANEALTKFLNGNTGNTSK